MKTDYASMRYPPSVPSEVGSHLTILRPRESTPSELMSTITSFLAANDFEVTWKRRAKFFFRILSFCMGPANIWRFPQQSFIYGNATYLYLYILYSGIVGVPLLVFEVSLSQYFVQGFAKLFTLCPIMEGITLAMAFYCIMAILLYSIVCVYSFIYFFSGFYCTMPHSYCSEYMKEFGCVTNYTAFKNSPEFVYFFNYIERLLDDKGYYFNWKTALLLILIWSIIIIITWFSILKYHLIVIILSVSIFFVLIYVAAISLSLEGYYNGLYLMFVPTTNELNEIRTWIYPLEQSVVSLGIGAGPLITFWSLSKLKHWSPIDTLIINLITFLCSLMSGMILYNAVGVVSYAKNKTIEEFIGNKHEEVHVHVLYTPLFNQLDRGVDNFTVIIYYLVLFFSCLYSLLEYVQILLLYISSSIMISKEKRKIVIIVTCVSLYLFSAIIGGHRWGLSFIMSINKNFIAPALLIIVSFELLSVSYFYGFRNFCDDIEFMLGFVPNYFYQITWLILPAVFFIFSIASLYLKFQEVVNGFDKAFLSLTIVLIIVPIISIAIFKCVTLIRAMGIRRVLNPRINESDWESESPSMAISVSSQGLSTNLENLESI